jgi:hypothetical protein
VPIPDGYIQPTGTKSITENGEHDVTEFAKVNVAVPTGGGGGSSDLPVGYRRADYIQFNGKEFIDTGIIGNQDTQINVAFTWESTTQRHLFGCLSEGNTTGITSYMNGSWRFGDKYSSKNFNLKEPKLPYSALVNKTKISTITSNSSISGVADFETIGTLLLGGARNADGSVPTAGIIGNLIKTNASISGAECGCQAEVGSACAMAAAALGELFELSIDKIEYAAEIAIEHHLGLTCDPICGLVQIPCIERNAVAAMRAINAVNLASFLWNTRKISLDKVIQTMKETGNDMHKSYKETSEAGLAKIHINK